MRGEIEELKDKNDQLEKTNIILEKQLKVKIEKNKQLQSTIDIELKYLGKRIEKLENDNTTKKIILLEKENKRLKQAAKFKAQLTTNCKHENIEPCDDDPAFAYCPDCETEIFLG